MISPSAHEPCSLLNFQIHFSVFLLSLNLIVLFPNNELCTITICFSFIFPFSFIMCACMLSCVWVFVTLWTVAHKSLLSMGLSGQQYWSGLPFPPPEDLPDRGIKPTFHLLHWRQILDREALREGTQKMHKKRLLSWNAIALSRPVLRAARMRAL